MLSEKNEKSPYRRFNSIVKWAVGIYQMLAPIKCTVFLFTFVLGLQQLYAQPTANPPCTNIGFEEGTFRGWTGSVRNRFSTTLPPAGLTQHCIMSPNMKDPFIDTFAVVPPGKTSALRLGNTGRGGGINSGQNIGGHLSSIRQTFRVDSSNMLFTYHYAVVVENPDLNDPNHIGLASPHFQARILDRNGNPITCAEYSVIVTTNLESYSRACVRVNDGNGNVRANNLQQNIGCPSGATGSNATPLIPIVQSVSTPNPGVSCGGRDDWMDLYYRDWRTVTVVLDQYLGQDVTIEFSAADCTPGGHLGYAYVAAECKRLNLALPGFICSGKETKLVSAPAGFASYNWTASNGGKIEGASNSQFITISSAGTYKVSVVPFTSASSSCPHEITYIVRDRCPISDTLCETVKGTQAATQVNLNSYNNRIKGNVPTSTVQSWHTSLPITSSNRIPNPTSVTVSQGTYYALILDPTIKNDTVGLTFEILSKPNANFDDLPRFCAGSSPFTIQNASPIGGIFSGSHVTSGGVFNPTAAGSFDLKYKVTNAGGCTDSITKKAVVETVAKITANGDSTICYQGTTLTLPLRSTASPSDSVAWSSPLGTIANTHAASTTLTVNGPVPFDNEFHVVVTQINKTCPLSKDSIRIRIKQLPTVLAPQDELICTNGGLEMISLQGNVLYEDSLRWDASGVSFSTKYNETTSASINTVYPDSNRVKIVLSAKKEACPTVKDSLLIRIYPIPTVVAANDTSYCSDQTSFRLFATAKGHTSTLWQAKNLAGQVAQPSSTSTRFSPQSLFTGGEGTFVISAFTTHCGIAKDSFVVELHPSTRVEASTQMTCLPDRRVLLAGEAFAGNDRTEARWKTSGTGRFLLPPDTLTNTYLPSPQDLSRGSVTLSLASEASPACPMSDTSFVWEIKPLPKLAIPTPKACENTAVQVEANKIEGATYYWGNAPASPLHTFSLNMGTAAHPLKVLVIDAVGCKDSTTLDLAPYPYPVFTLQGQAICPGELGIITVTLAEASQAADPTFAFRWQKGGVEIPSSAWDKLSYNQGGTFSLELGFHGCQKTNTVTIPSHPAPKLEMPLVYKYCLETDPPIHITPPSFARYLWHLENGAIDTNATIVVSPAKTSHYRLVVSNQFDCKDSALIVVKSVCPPRLFVPNVITPYSSDVNSVLQIFGANYTNFEITIFNRWGEIIFNTKDPKNAWDGIYKLENMPIGTYPWIVTYEGDSEEYKGPYKKVGEVTIVR